MAEPSAPSLPDYCLDPDDLACIDVYDPPPTAPGVGDMITGPDIVITTPGSRISVSTHQSSACADLLLYPYKF